MKKWMVACFAVMMVLCLAGCNSHEHTYTEKITRNATCAQEGVKTFTCSICGDTYEEPIAKKEHQYRYSVTKLATCSEEGITTYKCKNCGDTYTEPIAKEKHKYLMKVTKKATCISPGEKTYTCKECGDKYVEEFSDGDHNYVESVTKQATCLEEGTKKFTCSYCNNSYSETIPKAAHQYTDTITKEATCTDSGSKVRVCSVCGDTKEESINALGHKYTNATCTEPKKCQRCGVTSGNALGHNFKDLKCTRCGESAITIINTIPFTIRDYSGYSAEITSVKIWTETAYGFDYHLYVELIGTIRSRAVGYDVRIVNQNGVLIKKYYGQFYGNAGDTVYEKDDFYFDTLNPNDTYTLEIRGHE